MPDCCNPSAYGDYFDEKEARRNLRAYDRKGLDKMARRIVDYLASRGMQGRSVVEVGGGVGALQVELLKVGAEDAINVELSAGYEGVAAELLDREGLGDKVERRIGDFTELAAAMEADDVVMNRVIFCYPDMERLMDAATSTTRRFLAATFPTDGVVARSAFALANAYSRIRRVDFRAYVHPPDAILEVAGRAGFDVAFHERDLIWHGVVLERTASRAS
jgi:magnesium-protoporphyrin O-methyltransferase